MLSFKSNVLHFNLVLVCSVCNYITVLWNCLVLIKWAAWIQVSVSALSLPGVDSSKEEIAIQSILPSLLSILSNTVAREPDWITEYSHLFTAGALRFGALFYLTKLKYMDIKVSQYSSQIFIHYLIVYALLCTLTYGKIRFSVYDFDDCVQSSVNCSFGALVCFHKNAVLCMYSTKRKWNFHGASNKVIPVYLLGSSSHPMVP